jgi:hypothetical protein
VDEFGNIPDKGTATYDEIVVAQEAQITPVYVLRVSTSALSKLEKRVMSRADLSVSKEAR